MSSCCHNKAEEKLSLAIAPKLKWALIIFAIVFLASFLPFLHKLNHSLIEYLRIIWLPVILGFFIGGSVSYFIPEAFIFRWLGEKTKSSILRASLAGLALSACSHGMLAIAISLYKKGASIAAVITFLLASPWANLSMTFLLFSFFGWKALLIIAGALLIAVLTGFIFLFLEEKKWIEQSLEVDANQNYDWSKFRKFNFFKDMKALFASCLDLANSVFWWMLVGVLVAAVVSAYLPENFLIEYAGPSFTGLCVTLLIATVIEVCSEGTAPLALEIFQKTGALGNPFVFLLAGVATDYTEIGLLWTNIGKRTAILLPIITVPQILLYAYFLNWVF